MPLTYAVPGEVNYIKKITGRDEVRRHLAELGFVVGEPVKVVSKIGGSLIIAVKESRIALDEGLTGRIII